MFAAMEASTLAIFRIKTLRENELFDAKTFGKFDGWKWTGCELERVNWNESSDTVDYLLITLHPFIRINYICYTNKRSFALQVEFYHTRRWPLASSQPKKHRRNFSIRIIDWILCIFPIFVLLAHPSMLFHTSVNKYFHAKLPRYGLLQQRKYTKTSKSSCIHEYSMQSCSSDD